MEERKIKLTCWVQSRSRVGAVCVHLVSTYFIISILFEWNHIYQFLLLPLLFTCPVPKWTNTPLNIVINLSRGGPDTRLIRVAECVVGAALVSFCRVRKRGSWSANQVCRCYAKALRRLVTGLVIIHVRFAQIHFSCLLWC